MPQVFITKLLSFPPDTYKRIMARCRSKGENNVTQMIRDLVDYGLNNMPTEERIQDQSDYEPPPPPDLSFEEQMRRAGLSEEEIARNLQEVEEVLRKEGIKE